MKYLIISLFTFILIFLLAALFSPNDSSLMAGSLIYWAIVLKELKSDNFKL